MNSPIAQTFIEDRPEGIGPPLRGLGIQQLYASPAKGYPTDEEALAFAERNVCAHRREVIGKWPAPSPPHLSEGLVRTYSIEGFTLVHVTRKESQRSTRREMDGQRWEIRDAPLIARDGADRFALMLQVDFDRNIRQFGRSHYVKAGSCGMFCTSEPYVIETPPWGSQLELVALFMPRRFVSQRVMDCERYCANPSVEVSKLSGLVFTTLVTFGRAAWEYSREEFYKSARAVGDLIVLGLDTSADLSSGEDSVCSANLTRVKMIIGKRYIEPDLTLSDIAHAAGLSLSHLHKLFRHENQTVYEYLKAERLRHAYEQLRLSPFRKTSITQIALSCGFSDSSYFSRSFKQAFGVSPKDVAGCS